MKKLKCSGDNCEFASFDDMNNICPKCAKEAKIFEKGIEKMEEVMKNKRPRLK